MVQTKGFIAVGIILLFLGVVISPVTAHTAQKQQVELATVGDIGSLQLSAEEQTAMDSFIPVLFEKMSTATSYNDLITTVGSLIKEYGRHPLLVLILTLIIKAIQLNYKAHQLLPIRKSAFVMSMGFTHKLLSFGKNKINVMRPITTWYYSGRSNVMLNSRTLIVDPYPFSIRMLDGRQIGLMTDFIGLYIHLTGSLTEKAKTFFVGHAKTIRGYDLSPIHN